MKGCENNNTYSKTQGLYQRIPNLLVLRTFVYHTLSITINLTTETYGHRGHAVIIEIEIVIDSFPNAQNRIFKLIISAQSHNRRALYINENISLI